VEVPVLLQYILAAALMQTNPAPRWEVPAGAPPRTGPLLFEVEGGMDILVPLGNRGLGGWTGSGAVLDGFPLCATQGVSFRPAAFRDTRTGAPLICFSDDDGVMHLVDVRGREARGWPVHLGSSPVTGVSALDLNDDGSFEFAEGTADGRLHLIGEDGGELPGWPVSTGSRVEHEPSQVPLGGGQGFAVAVALTSARAVLYSIDGMPLPGWPCNPGFAVDTAPVSADISGDGISDIVFATGDRRLNVVSLHAASVPGWPYYLKKRALGGSMSMGMVDPEAGGPQVAVSTSDSLVYLLDPDGRLAGTWRWPVRAEGLPTAPIITTASNGDGIVLVATSSGGIQAWDGQGNLVQSACFELGEGVIYAPAAGDIDGDGRTEVVVAGMAGRLAAFALSSTDPGPWPQAQADSRNSGSYGLSFLPVVEVGDMSGEHSGDVTIPYSVSGAHSTSLLVAYSMDAGYSWSTTVHYTASSGSLIWHSEDDIGRTDSQDCLVRVTPFGSSGPGIAGMTNVFHVDNNSPPRLYLGSPRRLPGGSLEMRYAVCDREGDVLQIQAQYSVDGGASWRTARLSGTTLEIDPWLYGEPFGWNPGSDVEQADSAMVWFRARAADADPGPWAVLPRLEADSSLSPIAQVVVPSTRSGGDIHLGVRMVAGAGREQEVAYEYSLDDGTTWSRAATDPVTAGLTGIYDAEVIWRSRSDAPGFDCDRALVRATGTDGLTGVAVASAPFHLDDNYPPSIEILSPTGHGVFDGLVPISFGISDPEGDQVMVGLQYRLSRSDEWQQARGLLENGPFGPSQYRSVIRWNSSADLAGLSQVQAEFRLVASDRDTTTSDPEGPLALRNTDLPSVMQALVFSMDEGAGQLTVRFELADPRNRPLDLSVSWSGDGGRTWRAATVTGSFAGLVSPGYAGDFQWHYRTDLGASGGQFLLRLTPLARDAAGPPRVLQIMPGY